MVYTSERFPEEMNDLPADVRKEAIRITNSMMVDGDIRVHEDIIVAYAIHRAQFQEGEKERGKVN